MKMGFQAVSIIGNATKDAETKVSKDGVSYVTFRVAVSGTDGAATFYNILVFGHYGGIIRDHIVKGRQIYVCGKLQVSDKGYISVIADHIELLAVPRSKKAKKEEEEYKEKQTTDAKVK